MPCLRGWIYSFAFFRPWFRLSRIFPIFTGIFLETYGPCPFINLRTKKLIFSTIQALLLCFKLQESRIAVVSSTAAATLRQLVMFVVDKMVLEDRISESSETPSQKLAKVQLPNGTTKQLGPSARDTFSVFEDLCLLANSEKPRFLKLEFLHKTFALELIESVLTNYHELFSQVFLVSLVFPSLY